MPVDASGEESMRFKGVRSRASERTLDAPLGLPADAPCTLEPRTLRKPRHADRMPWSASRVSCIRTRHRRGLAHPGT